MAFQCSLVTPEQQFFDGKLVQAIVPAHDGLVGICTGRAPLLVKLGVGPLRLDLPDGGRKFYFLDGGLAQMKDNRLTILAGEVVPAEQIDYEAAAEEYRRAMAAPIADDEAARQRAHALASARAKQALASRSR